MFLIERRVNKDFAQSTLTRKDGVLVEADGATHLLQEGGGRTPNYQLFFYFYFIEGGAFGKSA